MTVSQRAWRIVHSESSLGWGGQEHRVLAELRGFQKRGSTVWLLAPTESEIFRRAQAQKISVEPLRVDRRHFPFEAIRLARWLWQNRVQILNTHSSRDGWLLGVAGRLARVPLIIRTRHIDVTYPNRWLSRHAFTTFADQVLTTSEKITKHFQEIFKLPDRCISTMPTGIDLNAFLPTGEKAKLVAGDENKPLIGMISVLRSWKGHTTFLEAVAQLKSAGFDGRFIIVGEGPIRKRIEKQISELNLGDVVTLTGHREDIPAVLRALSILVIPSTKHEGVPQIGLQALACKKPVVGSDAGGIPEIIRQEETGRIFPAGNATALATAVRETLASPDKTRAYCERGHELVEARHNLDAMLDSLDALYCRHIPGTRE
jgi:glycosyltransferase involved in cell wall biosynthesis